jgi:hypothetical protein
MPSAHLHAVLLPSHVCALHMFCAFLIQQVINALAAGEHVVVLYERGKQVSSGELVDIEQGECWYGPVECGPCAWHGLSTTPFRYVGI